MAPSDRLPCSPSESGLERATPDMDGERAIADTLYAATEEMEHAVPELRATTDSIADVIAPLIYEIDPSTLQVDEPIRPHFYRRRGRAGLHGPYPGRRTGRDRHCLGRLASAARGDHRPGRAGRRIGLHGGPGRAGVPRQCAGTSSSSLPRSELRPPPRLRVRPHRSNRNCRSPRPAGRRGEVFMAEGQFPGNWEVGA